MAAINANGFVTLRNTDNRAPDPQQVAVAEEFLSTLARTKKATWRSPGSYTLKHVAERWSKARGGIDHVSNGALLHAAMNLGIPVQQFRTGGETNGYVGVSLERRGKPRAPSTIGRQAILGRSRGAAAGPVLEAALHEAAHLVATCACPGSWIVGVELGTRTRGKRAAGLGRCLSAEVEPDETAFVLLVGLEWERAHGDPLCGAVDAWEAASAFVLYPYVLPAAAAFVKRYESTIRRTAEGIVNNMTAQGSLRGRKLEPLVARLRAEVEAFTRPPGGLTPDKALQHRTWQPEWDREAVEIVRQLTMAPCWTPEHGVCAACANGAPDSCGGQALGG